MRIGMGGGAASSMAAGANAAELDFDSVQRGNPEIERRAQEVINHCWSLGEDNPVLAIHDVGRGRAVERLPGAGRRRRAGGALRPVAPCRSRSPGWRRRRSGATRPRSATSWRWRPSRSPLFAALCERERCPYAVVGVARDDGRLVLGDGPDDRDDEDRAIDMPMEVLLGKPPRMTRDVTRVDAGRRLARPRRARPARGRVRRAAPPDGRLQALPRDHRRPHRRRADPPRPDGRAVAGAGRRLRGDAGRPRRLRRRGDGHRRAHAARLGRRAGIRPDGGRRGADQPARRADRPRSRA